MTITDEQAALDDLEQRYQDGDYTRSEMPVVYSRWLASTKTPAEWWPRLPSHIRDAIIAQLAARDGVFVGAEVSAESEEAYRDLLDVIAKAVGLHTKRSKAPDAK